jgi:carbon-monoxide dehydrogenase medium subunit
MYPAKFDYVRAESLDQAVALLASHGDDARLLAGGHSLIPAMRFRLAQPQILIDLNGIDGLEYIREESGYLTIGAMTREVLLEESAVVQNNYQLLADAAAVIADPVMW